MPQIKHQLTKTLKIRPNGRSADFVTPNFIYGCAGGCRNSYCYVMRYNYEKIYINDNSDQILAAIATHVDNLPVPKPANQTDPVFWTYDIGCATDISLHWKHYDWRKVFNFFRDIPTIKATFATKYVNPKMLSYSPQYKIRIRFSLMPQKISHILEPRTSSIEERISIIPLFIEQGYEVHLNFSPIVVYKEWLADYEALFKQIDHSLPSTIKENILAECIFLTHNYWQHERNLAEGRNDIENLLWLPKWQEGKQSEYGSEAVRYHRKIKSQLITKWQKLHQKIIPWNKIRYIF